MISVAMLSKWHVHAGDYARQVSENPNLEIKCVWDEDLSRGETWAKELGVPFVQELSKVLEDSAIDAVIVDTPTNIHKEVILSAARAGKHIFTEKVLAFTVADCEEIFAAVEEAGVKLMVSLPRLMDPHYLYAQQLLDEGVLGELTNLRCRLSHDGAVPKEGQPYGWLPEHFFNPETCGGGALIDLGAHPIYVTNRLAGDAKALSAHLSSFLGHEVDDHSVVVVEYASGAQGIIEAGFVAKGSPFILECYGTKGSLLIGDDRVIVHSETLQRDESYREAKLPENHPSAMTQWVDEILHGTEPLITKWDILKLTEINEAAAQSNREGKRVSL